MLVPCIATVQDGEFRQCRIAAFRRLNDIAPVGTLKGIVIAVSKNFSLYHTGHCLLTDVCTNVRLAVSGELALWLFKVPKTPQSLTIFYCDHKKLCLH